MTRHIHAHFDGKYLVPDQPVDLPVGQPLELDVVVGRTNGTANGHALPTPEAIEKQFRKLEALGDLMPGPVIPLEALRRENMYDDRT